MAAALARSGQYRVLRRFVPAETYQVGPVVDPSRVRAVLVVDVETTGLRKETDRIIDLGFVLAEFDRLTGQVMRVLERYSGFEDPEGPIPAAITQLTGIRDEDVRGQRLDDVRVEAAIARADLVVAHNAPFDRGFLELRYPSFETKWWACSQREAPWAALMTGSTKLEWLAYHLGQVFYDAHRALIDAEVLLFLLAQPGPGGRSILSHVLESSGRKTYCVWADNAPFEMKDTLKLEKGYAWNDGSRPGRPIKAWFKEPVIELDAELAMLAAEVFRRPARVSVDVITGRERYTDRFASRNQFELPVQTQPAVGDASGRVR